MTPRGKAPLSSTERMRLKRMRDRGELPPLKTCSECGKVLKFGASTENKAYDAGLCWEHWKISDAGRHERARQNLKKKSWGVAYFGGKPGEDIERFKTLRKAVEGSYVGRGQENGPVYVVWQDGKVTEHHGLTTRSAVGLSPDKGELVTDDPGWFRDKVEESQRKWFEV